MADTHVKGLAELDKFLETLPAKLQRAMVRSALRAGATVIKDAAVASINSHSGLLAKSYKVSTGSKGPIVTAKIRSKLFYSKFVEYGTRPHFIAARSGGALSIGGVLRTGVEHPGASARPHVRPAIDTRMAEATRAVAEKLKERLTKEGLEVEDVELEGDE